MIRGTSGEDETIKSIVVSMTECNNVLVKSHKNMFRAHFFKNWEIIFNIKITLSVGPVRFFCTANFHIFVANSHCNSQ